MKEARSHKVILKNFSFLTVSTALSQAISLIAILRITSVLTPETYGEFSFLVAQGTLLYTIADLGLRHVVIRAVARDADKSRSLFVAGLFVKSIALLFAVFAYTIYNYAVGSLPFISVIHITLFSAFNCSANLFENIFFGRQRMWISGVMNVAYSVLWLTCLFVIPQEWFNSQDLFIIFIGINALRAMLFLFALGATQSITGNPTPLLESAKKLLIEAWPYFAIILIMLPFTSLPANFLQLKSTVEQVGFFSLAQRFLGPISIVMELALAAIFPNLSSLWMENKIEYRSYVASSFRFYVLLNLSLCFFFTLFAKEIVQLLFSDAYLPAVKVSKIHVWYLYLALIDSLIGTILSAANGEKFIMKFALIRTALSTPVLYLASAYGAAGLSLANVGSSLVFLSILWLLFTRKLQLTITHSWYLFGATIILAATSYLMEDKSLLAKTSVGLAYCIVTGYYFLRTFKMSIRP